MTNHYKTNNSLPIDDYSEFESLFRAATSETGAMVREAALWGGLDHPVNNLFQSFLHNGLNAYKIRNWVKDFAAANPEHGAAQILKDIYNDPRKYGALQGKLIKHFKWDGKNIDPDSLANVVRNVQPELSKVVPGNGYASQIMNRILTGGVNERSVMQSPIKGFGRATLWVDRAEKEAFDRATAAGQTAPELNFHTSPGADDVVAKWDPVDISFGDYLKRLDLPPKDGIGVMDGQTGSIQGQIKGIGEGLLRTERRVGIAHDIRNTFLVLSSAAALAPLTIGAVTAMDAYNKMHTPTSQEIQQTQPGQGDEFHYDTSVDPNTADPNQIYQQQTQDSQWGPNGAKAQQYNAAHPPASTPPPADQTNPAPASPAPASPAPASGAPASGAGGAPIFMPNTNLDNELRRIHSQSDASRRTAQAQTSTSLADLLSQPTLNPSDLWAKLISVIMQNGGWASPRAGAQAAELAQQAEQQALAQQAALEQAANAAIQGLPQAVAPTAAPAAPNQASVQAAITDMLMRRVSRVSLADENPITKFTNIVQDFYKNTTNIAPTDGGGTNVIDHAEGGLENAANTEQENASGLATEGVGRDSEGGMLKVLVQSASQNPADAAKIMQHVTMGAQVAMTDEPTLFQVAYAIAKRTPGNGTRVCNILDGLCQWESKAPRSGILQAALKAAQGQDISQDLAMLQAVFLGMDPTANGATLQPLMAALVGCGMPNSSLKALTDSQISSRVRTKTQEYDLASDVMRALIPFNKTRAEYERKYMADIEKDLPGYLQKDWVQKLIKGISSVATVNDLFAAAKNITGLGGVKGTLNNMAPAPTKGAASKFRRVAVAQAPSPDGSQPPPPGGQPQPPPGGPPPAPAVPAAPAMPYLAGIGQAGNAAQNGMMNPLYTNQIAQMSDIRAYVNGVTIAQQQIESSMPMVEQMLGNIAQMMGGQKPNQQADTYGIGAIMSTPYATGQNVVQMGAQVTQMATQLNQILILGQQNLASLMQKIGAKRQQGWRPQFQDELWMNGLPTRFQNYAMRIKDYQFIAINLRVIGPSMQNVIDLETKRNEAWSAIEASPNGLGVQDSVERYARCSMDISQLYDGISKKFSALASGTTDPNLKKHAQDTATKYLGLAQKVRGEGMKEYMRMLGPTAGIGVTGYGSSSGTMPGDRAASVARDMNTLLEKHGMQAIPVPDKVVVADKELEDYYNDLFKNTPGSPDFGTALEDAPDDAGIPTTEIGKKTAPKRHHMKFRKKVDLSD